MPAAFCQRGGAVTRQLSSLLNASHCDAAQTDSAHIRPHWVHAVAAALQPVVGELYELDTAGFDDAFRQLARVIPAPVNGVERVMLRHQLMEFALKIGDDFHRLRHPESLSGCAFLPIESAARVWFNRDCDPRRLLTEWAAAYATAFGRHHQTPSMVRACRLLQQRSNGRADIGTVARDVGMSRSSFVKTFVRTLGVTPMEYHTRARLRHFIRALRESDAKISAAADAVGYKSEKIYAVLKRVTGLHPSEVRQLSHATLDQLMEGPLQTDVSKLMRWRSEQRHRGEQLSLTA